MGPDTSDDQREAVRARVLQCLIELRQRADAAAGEAPLAAAVVGRLAAADVDARVDEVVPGRPNLVARVGGGGDGPDLLLAGHFNSGYAPHGWSTDPREVVVVDGSARAGAVTDMLGAMAAMVVAIELLAAAPEPPPGDVVLLLTMSHDVKAVGLKYALAADKWPRYAVWADPTDLDLLLAHGGSVRWRIDLGGRAAHVTSAGDGIDALAAAVEAARAVRGLSWTHDPHPALPSLPRGIVGSLRAGSSPGLIADRAELSGDVRTVPGMTADTVRADLARCVAGVVDPRVRVTVTVTAEQRPFVRASAGPLIDAIAAAHQHVLARPLERMERLPGQAYCTGASDLHAAGIDTVVYGPGAFRWAPDEAVRLDELEAVTHVYASLPARLATAAVAHVADDAASATGSVACAR